MGGLTRRVMRRRALAFGVAAGLVSACAAGVDLPLPGPLGGNNDREASAQSRPSAAPVGDPASGVRIGELASRRDFESGDCGLFLWTRSADPRLVFYADPARETAAIQLDGREVALRRLDVTGAPDGDQYGVQVFASASGEVTARLTINQSEPIENGAMVPSANLRVTDARGWSTVLAVGGLAACQP